MPQDLPVTKMCRWYFLVVHVEGFCNIQRNTAGIISRRFKGHISNEAVRPHRLGFCMFWDQSKYNQTLTTPCAETNTCFQINT